MLENSFICFAYCYYCYLIFYFFSFFFSPQWGAADAEIKVPSVENRELKGSPFKARSRSVYSHTCHAYCQGFPPCLFLPFRSIHLHFFSPNLSRFFLCWLWLTRGSCVGPQNKIGHPARCRFPCWVLVEYIYMGSKVMTCKMTCEMNNLEIEWSLCLALM